MMEIDSFDNKKVKEIDKLKTSKYSKEKKLFLVEGRHLVLEALNAGVLKEVVKLSYNDVNYNVSETIISEKIMKKLSILPSFTDVIGVCKYALEKTSYGDKIIVLDGVQDPGNLGTIIRSAVSFSFDTIVLSSTSVNKYNDKVIRASQGMIFKTNIINRDLFSFIDEVKELGYMVYGTDVKNGINVKEIEDKTKLVIVVGNEGTGLSDEVKTKIDKNIYIKMNKSCESLNVAVAASIIMYELN